MTTTLKAQQHKAEGRNILVGSVGEPNEDVAVEIKDALVNQLRSQPSRYGSAQGLHSTRKELSAWFKKIYGADYSPQQIIVTPGSKFGLYSLMQILCDENDEVLIPAPYWVSYLSQAKMAKALPIVCLPDSHYKLTPRLLEKCLSPRSRLLIINSPNNPTGSVYSKKELQELHTVLIDHPQITVICDDIYNQLVFSDSKRAPSLLDVANEDFRRRIIIVHGASKSYCMTGWRIGWIAAESECIEKLTTFFSQTLTCIPDFIQIATQTALSGGEQIVADLKNKIMTRRKWANNELNAVPSISVYPSEGAFYLWIAFKDKAVSSAQVADRLFAEKDLAVVPGEAFGLPYHLRLSVTLPDEDFKKAVLKIKDFFTNPN